MNFNHIMILIYYVVIKRKLEYRHTERQADRQTDRQTDCKKNREKPNKTRK